jgi:AcrR family transcriptional regulator
MARRLRIRRNDPAGLRSRVLDAAARSFQANGYGATSVHNIVRAAAVTGGALHHHFPSKKDLALAVLGERVVSEVEQTWIAAVNDAPSGAEGIMMVFDRTADALDRRGVVEGCPLGNLAIELSLADEELRAAVAQAYRDWRDAIAARFRRDAEAGLAPFAYDDPDALADVVVAMFTGAMSIARAEQKTAALRACAQHLCTLLGQPPAPLE